MKVKKLTPAEAKWLKDFQALMDTCPSKRLAAYTVGDPDLVIYDKPVFDAYRNANSRDDRDDVVLHDELRTKLGRISMPFLVDGVCG